MSERENPESAFNSVYSLVMWLALTALFIGGLTSGWALATSHGTPVWVPLFVTFGVTMFGYVPLSLSLGTKS